MREIIVSALVAAVISGVVLMAFPRGDDPAERAERAAAQAGGAQDGGTQTGVGQPAPAAAPPSLRYTAELVEDAWVDAARTAGTDHKPLADAATSICFLTRIEIAGVESPDDTNSCAIGIDDFTGFWEVRATVEEGGRSSVRCNARCLVWE